MRFLKVMAMLPRTRLWLAGLTVAAAALSVSGCTGPVEYLRNGLKVGPNYHGARATRRKALDR